MATTIGTSTNLLVVGIAEKLGVPAIGLFDFAHIVAIAAIVALPYLWLVVPRLLPKDSGNRPRVSLIFDAALEIHQRGFAAGRELHEVLRRARGMRPLRLVRGSIEIVQLPTVRLQPGDRLLIQDTPEGLREHAAALGRIGRQHRVNLSLRQHHVAAHAKTGVQHHVADVAAADFASLQQELALAGREQAPRHRNLAARLGDLALAHLQETLARHSDTLTAVRGRGLLIGVEFADADVAGLTIAQCAHQHLLAAYTLNTPRVVRLEPPLILTESQLDDGLGRLDAAITAAEELVATTRA
jgi:hypothetical protein